MEIVSPRAKVEHAVQPFQAEAYMPDGSFQLVKLQEQLDKGKWVILFFWPLNFTSVCPTEVIAMSEELHRFEREGAIVLGISTDSKQAHRAWCKLPIEEGGVGKVGFPMLEDLNHKVSRYFDVLLEEKGIALRGTFIISPDGILQSAAINNTDIGRNIEEILRTLSALQTGSLCPMNWQDGDETL